MSNGGRPDLVISCARGRNSVVFDTAVGKAVDDVQHVALSKPDAALVTFVEYKRIRSPYPASSYQNPLLLVDVPARRDFRYDSFWLVDRLQSYFEGRLSVAFMVDVVWAYRKAFKMNATGTEIDPSGEFLFEDFRDGPKEFVGLAEDRYPDSEIIRVVPRPECVRAALEGFLGPLFKEDEALTGAENPEQLNSLGKVCID